MIMSSDKEPYCLPYQVARDYASKIQNLMDTNPNDYIKFNVKIGLQTFVERALSNHDFYFVQNGYPFDFFTKFNIAYLDMSRKRIKKELIPLLKYIYKFLQHHITK